MNKLRKITSHNPLNEILMKHDFVPKAEIIPHIILLIHKLPCICFIFRILSIINPKDGNFLHSTGE